jgi:O-antigen biosynthesis protein
VYRPAYYEDADYCVRLWKAGKRVVYEPAAVVLHFEFASSPSADRATAMQAEWRGIFAERHCEWLAGQQRPGAARILRARDRRSSGLRILVFDDRVPRASMGFGFPRAVDLLRTLADLGHFVTLYPTAAVGEPWYTTGGDIPREVEVESLRGPAGIRSFMEERRGYYDCVVVSRSHNMEMLRAKLGPPDSWSPRLRVVYDAEALTAVREFGRHSIRGATQQPEELERMIAAEIEHARGVDAVLAVSEGDRRQFLAAGLGPVHVVSLSVQAAPTPRAFADRHDILFVGSFHELSPNADAVCWFATAVLPIVRASLELDVRFVIVGQNAPSEVLALDPNRVDLCPSVDDLRPFYDRARIFVAPTRFAAGIPFKVAHAAAHGVPLVCTSLLATQLGWQAGRDVLAADTPEDFAAACTSLYTSPSLWAQVRAAALERVAAEYDPAQFKAAVGGALTTVLSRPPSLQQGANT